MLRYGASSDIQSIVILRALMLGDMICAGPAFAALRSAFPHAHIALIGLPWATDFFRRLPGRLDELIEFPGYPGLPERALQVDLIPPFLQRMQARRFDLAIQLHGSGSIVNPLIATLGANQLAGYFRPGEYCPDADHFIPYPDRLPEIWKHLRLLQHLNIPVESDQVHLEVSAEDELAVQTLRTTYRISSPYVCLHPGTNAAWRCWPTKYYAEVGDALSRLGHTVVVTGSEKERELAQEVISQMQQTAINLAGLTGSPCDLAALIKNAALLISGDTGVAHLGCAVQVPSVIIFMKSEGEGWPPLNRVKHRVVCALNGVNPQQVIREAEQLLGCPKA